MTLFLWHYSYMLSNSWSLSLEIQIWNASSQQQRRVAGQHSTEPCKHQAVLREVPYSGPCPEAEEGQMSDSAGTPTSLSVWQEKHQLFLGMLWLQESTSVRWVKSCYMLHSSSLCAWFRKTGWGRHSQHPLNSMCSSVRALWLVLSNKQGADLWVPLTDSGT